MTRVKISLGGDDRPRRMIWPRWLAHLLAKLGGYFWLPCPICGKPFAGFEWGPSLDSEDLSSGQGVCSRRSCVEEAARRNAANNELAWQKHGIRHVGPGIVEVRK